MGTTVSNNIGIDLTMMDYRFNFTVDLYRNLKRDMLLQERLPPSAGVYQPRAIDFYATKVTNAGNMTNTGVEISANFRNQTKFGLGYKITGTLTRNINVVTDLNGVERGYGNGRPVFSRGENID